MMPKKFKFTGIRSASDPSPASAHLHDISMSVYLAVHTRLVLAKTGSPGFESSQVVMACARPIPVEGYHGLDYAGEGM
jgi:hypothetical protein